MKLFIHFPQTPPWCGAQLKHRDKLTFTLLIPHMEMRNTYKILVGKLEKSGRIILK
jgi:hypothetical protein